MAEAGDEFHSLAEAKQSPEWPYWECAIQSELDQLREKGTWKLIDPPENAIPLTNKWVFVKKKNKEGKVIKYKARLVAKGCAQRPGYDYLETHSPVVRFETIRAILAIATQDKLLIQQMDVKGAYLNGHLKETIYMRQPEGFSDETNRICLLVKTLYGLKQSGREWNIEFDKQIRKHNFKRLRADPCAYIRRSDNDVAIITVWVDDLLLFAGSEKAMESMKKDLRSEWEITDMGEPSKIIGIEIKRTNDSITISQKKNVESILIKQGYENINSVTTPLDPKIKLEPNPEGNEGDRSNAYAQLLGELQFVANATRPDITYAVNRLASYTANPDLKHQSALKRVLRYLSGTRNYGITYKKIPNEKPTFLGYTDAAFADRDDLKSTAGYVVIAAGSAITWKSGKEKVTAQSTTEAEYIALWEGGQEIAWLRNLYRELGYSQSAPTIIYCDNTGAVAIAKNPLYHKRTKHIDTKYHWVREKVQAEIISAESCRTENQTADILTKPLAREKHVKHATEMGLVPV
jgi:Reverse transcriptase (RNA-dependent DNA polymerase)